VEARDRRTDGRTASIHDGAYF